MASSLGLLRVGEVVCVFSLKQKSVFKILMKISESKNQS